MKTQLIKLSLVCIASAALFAGCVKKEETTQAEQGSNVEVESANQHQAATSQPAHPEAVPLQETTAEPVESIQYSEPQVSAAAEVPRPTPAASPERTTNTEAAEAPRPTPAVATPKPAPVASTPKPAEDHNSNASVDDAVAEAMKAAEPAIQ